MPQPLTRILFMGTAELACASLEALSGHPQFELVAVVTQPDRPRGRDLQIRPGAVKQLALEKNLSVLQPERARDPQFIESIRKSSPDLITVVAYGQILPQSILQIPQWGCLNVHTSLLPKHRGAAPIQAALLAGDSETGVTIMKMDEGLDTGEIVSQASTVITDEDNAQTLHDRLAGMGAALLIQTIDDLLAGKAIPRPQPAGATYARKITREDGALDWQLPARELWNRLRALTPWPGAFTFQSNRNRQPLIKIIQAQPVPGIFGGAPGEVLESGSEGILVRCGEGALRVLRLQREGSRPCSAPEFLAGNPMPKGTLLISERPKF